MATSLLEREMRRRVRRGEAPAMPQVLPNRAGMEPQTLPNAAPAAPDPGVLSQLFSNLLPISSAQAAPAPAPAPAPAQQQGPFKNAAATPSPPPMQATPGAPIGGLMNFAGNPMATQMMMENWQNAQPAGPLVDAPPTVAPPTPYPWEGFGASGAVLPTGPQYPTVWGRPDPQGVFDPRDPAPSWMGNVPRAMVNFLPGVVGS